MIDFVKKDAVVLYQDLISNFERLLHTPLYPGDERRIFLEQFSYVYWLIYNKINETANKNLIRFATGDVLDALGERINAYRLPAQKARTIIRFELSAAQSNDIIIPFGTRITPDGVIYFKTIEDLIISSGALWGSVEAEAAEAGEMYNGFSISSIQTLVDPLPYISTCYNTTIPTGGADAEDDSRFRERVKLAVAGFSNAGSTAAYIYWAKSADSNISDVYVASPTPGVVNIYVLLENGQLPSSEVIDKVNSICSADTVRPLTDNVQVLSPISTPYDIYLNYSISLERSKEESAIRNEIETTVINEFILWQKEKLGRHINPYELVKRVMTAGAASANTTGFNYQELLKNQVALSRNINISYRGLV